MRILLTGGGTGGHFYPIIAIIEELSSLAGQKNKKIQLYFASNTIFDKDALSSTNTRFVKIPAGKVRNYTSILNIVDFFITGWGIVVALIKLFFIYPDVVFGKGGYASFPTLVAARILAIPVIIHESDTVPGRVNLWAGKFAKNVAVSWQEAGEHFKKEKTAVTGQPVRKSIAIPIKEGSHEHFGFSPSMPILTVLGGSQGAKRINDFILDILPKLLEKYQVLHQTGKDNFEDVHERAQVIFQKNQDHAKYKAVPFLSDEELQKMAGITTLLISRSGSGIFEFSTWGIPSILIPIPESISRDQRSNAYAYARRGAGIVIEEDNLTETVFLSELARILGNNEEYQKMSSATQNLQQQNAAQLIAYKLLALGETH